jgi:uncharacterized coiled-coil DUF342 family protein
MTNELVKQLNEIEKEILDAHKVYESKMAIAWNKIQKLKKELRDVNL